MSRPGRLVLLGHPVAHSLSPKFQNAALRAAGIPLEYEALDVTPALLASVMQSLVVERAAGNVTIPHKEAAFALCASTSPVAARVGAINTFWVEHGALVGDNTDVGGFDAAIQTAFGPPAYGWRVAVIGAGGAAAAVLAAIERWPSAHARITSRTQARATTLARRFASVATPVKSIADAVRDADLVVNATPVGLHDDLLPVDPALLGAKTLVFDLVYRRNTTPLVLHARARGLRAADGRGMLLEQGAQAFVRWFGVEPDRDTMRNALP